MNLEERNGYLDSLQRLGIKLELDRVSRFLDGLGRPAERFRALLVTGTNGKGSVSTYLSSALSHMGFRTGLYTSPHLVRVEERIKIDGAQIPEETLTSLVGFLKEKVDEAISKGVLPQPLTFFELLTVAAFLWFKEEKVDWAVLEIGLGGRLDATNVVNPEASVITTVALDHTQILGKTVAQIAREKAGIVKPGKPVIIGKLPPSARRVIEETCQERNAPLFGAFDPPRRLLRNGRAGWLYRSEGGDYLYRPSLLGVHQAYNAAIALKTLELLSLDPLNPERVCEKALLGLQEAKIEGRLEWARENMLLDGAHNPAGMATLVAYLKSKGLRNLSCLFGVSNDKRMITMARLLFPFCRRVVLTRSDVAKAQDPLELSHMLRQAGLRVPMEVELDPQKALARLREGAQTQETLLVTGSLYLVGNIKAILERE